MPLLKIVPNVNATYSMYDSLFMLVAPSDANDLRMASDELMLSLFVLDFIPDVKPITLSI